MSESHPHDAPPPPLLEEDQSVPPRPEEELADAERSEPDRGGEPAQRD